MYGGRIICHLYKVLKFVGKRFELTKIFELFKNVNVEFFGKEYNAKILNEDLMIIIPKKNFSLYVNSFLPDIFISDVSDHTGTMFEFVFPKVVRFILMIFTLLLLLLQLIILLNVRIGVDFNIIAFMPMIFFFFSHIGVSVILKVISNSIFKQLMQLICEDNFYTNK